MKKILFAMAVAAGVVVSSNGANAQWGGPPGAGGMPGGMGMGMPPGGMQGMPYGPPPGASMAPSGGGASPYGWNPMFKKVLWWKKDSSSPCGKNGKGCADANAVPAPGSGLPGSPGASMPGTLVFPQNPYIRSPRDFFMYGQSGN